ncbi:MAG: damage repair protein [Bacilli bacterium]|nr:damage repair protein [Bacilli bacterium]
MNPQASKAQKEKVYAVIDIKSFYASVECAARGLDLFSAPLVVADKSRTDNSIVMSVTPYLKKNYGVSNVCRIKDLPQLKNMIFATPRMAYYIEVSAKIVSIFLDFVAEEDLHVYSIDESFLQIGPYLKAAKATPEEFCARILKRIKDELGLVATAGIGSNMFLAKACLDNEAKKKPPYIAYWRQEDVPTKLWKISPITKIWGIAEGISSHLSRIGIDSVEALAKVDVSILKEEFGVMGYQLHQMANGIDGTDIEAKYTPRERNLSIGQTLIKDYDRKGALLVLREMNDELCFRLREAKQKTGCVSLFIGFGGGGGSFAKQMSLNIATDDVYSLFKASETLFNKSDEDYPIRALGISFGKLSEAYSRQYSLLEDQDEEEERWQLTLAIDKAHRMFGKNSVLRASSLLKDSTIIERHGQIGGHRA